MKIPSNATIRRERRLFLEALGIKGDRFYAYGVVCGFSLADEPYVPMWAGYTPAALKRAEAGCRVGRKAIYRAALAFAPDIRRQAVERLVAATAMAGRKARVDFIAGVFEPARNPDYAAAYMTDYDIAHNMPFNKFDYISCYISLLGVASELRGIGRTTALSLHYNTSL